MNWHSLDYRRVLKTLESDPKSGLSSKEAARRAAAYGENKLDEKKRANLLIRLLLQFNDFMIVILIAAAAISFGASVISGGSDFADPIIILLIVTVNAILGLVQESRAEKSLDALKKLSAPAARVLRDGALQTVSASSVVPGDIIALKTGDFVPADARLLSSASLRAEESALTGESQPVEKSAEAAVHEAAGIGDRLNMVFSGSAVVFGHATAVVVETGMKTEVGKIAGMIIREESPQTPLQQRLENTGKQLGIGCLSICAVIFALGVFRHLPPFDMFLTSVSLAVAAIPEGLPAIVTIVLAIGVQRMAKRGAIIRKLPAVETLGGASVICSDKTGTLTQNRMTVVEVTGPFGEGRRSIHKEVLRCAALCSNAVADAADQKRFAGEPTECAIVRAAQDMGYKKSALDADWERALEIPFDSSRKLMTTAHKTGKGYLIITKGAPDVLLNRCANVRCGGEATALDAASAGAVLKTNARMAGSALRVIGVAVKEAGSLPRSERELADIESGLTFIGFVGLLDPPRPEARAAVATCKNAGIKPVMITGDHIVTARTIAKNLGIFNAGDKAMTGEELDRTAQAELERHIGEYSVFARVSPEHKVRIVKAFQANGSVCAMTGDGVNDAPALKAADIGCAMGQSGTDVAKGAADMILTDDNFSTIVEAVREGRGIYVNIRKAVHFLLSSNIGELITIFVAIVMGWAPPLIAIQLLWVNLVTDSLPAIALGLDPADPNIMNRKPYDNHKSLFAGGLWQRIGLEGVMIGMLALLAFGAGCVFFDIGGSYVYGRTMAFATLSISQLVHAFNMRSETSLLKIDLLGNRYLIWAFFAGLFLQVIVITAPPLAHLFKVAPLPASAWFIVAALCFMPIVIVELEKLVNTRLYGRPAPFED